MKLSFFLLIAAFAAISVESRAVVDKPKVNCMIKRLKSVDKLDASYPEYQNVEARDCAANAEQMMKDSYRGTVASLLSNSIFNPYAQCMFYDLMEKDYSDILYLQAVYSVSETISESERKTKLDKISEDIRSSIEDSFYICATGRIFSPVFDTYFKETESNEVNAICNRQYCVKHGLGGLQKYPIVVNPNHIDIPKETCENYWKTSATEMDEVIVKKIKPTYTTKESECVYRKVREGNFDKYIRQLTVLRELPLTSDEKSAAKNKFITALSQVYRIVHECEE